VLDTGVAIRAPSRGAKGRAYAALLGVLCWLVLGPLSLGCGDSCEDLQEMCDRCRDPNQKASCEQAVDSNDAKTCARNANDFEDVCPE
jgi:hypothetical protein